MANLKNPSPAPVSRALRIIGAELATWRRLRRLTAGQVADRAGIARSTVVNLEQGRSVSLENTLRIARALGVLDSLVAAIDPYASDVGRLRSEEILPRRVRRPRAVAGAGDDD